MIELFQVETHVKCNCSWDKGFQIVFQEQHNLSQDPHAQQQPGTVRPSVKARRTREVWQSVICRAWHPTPAPHFPPASSVPPSLPHSGSATPASSGLRTHCAASSCTCSPCDLAFPSLCLLCPQIPHPAGPVLRETPFTPASLALPPWAPLMPRMGSSIVSSKCRPASGTEFVSKCW